MTALSSRLDEWVEGLSDVLSTGKEINFKSCLPFLAEPELALPLLDLVDAIDNSESEKVNAQYSACLFAMDICVAQLQSAVEQGSKPAQKVVRQLMDKMTQLINKGNHPINFWLPLLNAFYEARVELTPAIKEAYLNLAGEEKFPEEKDYLTTLQNMLTNLSHLSVFGIAKHFFSQTYAMPPDFFADLVIDLFSLDDGQEVAILTLLHPHQAVREVVIAAINEIIRDVSLNSRALSRLQIIKNWYPKLYHAQFASWIKIQRKKGVVFLPEQPKPKIKFKAGDVDGRTTEEIFLHFNKDKKKYHCGMLLSEELGIKEAWVMRTDLKVPSKYNGDIFDEIPPKPVDFDYISLMVEHCLAIMMNREDIPSLHVLEIQELIGENFSPKLIDVPALIEQLSIEITPFTPEEMQNAFKRMRAWFKRKDFTVTWYVEGKTVDKLVNRYSTMIKGVRTCETEKAIAAVFTEVLEAEREKWRFHFLWVALWLKSKPRKNDKTWQDSFLTAYAIHSGMPLDAIPVMKEICQQTVQFSIQTMNERGTYLT